MYENWFNQSAWNPNDVITVPYGGRKKSIIPSCGRKIDFPSNAKEAEGTLRISFYIFCCYFCSFLDITSHLQKGGNLVKKISSGSRTSHQWKECMPLNNPCEYNRQHSDIALVYYFIKKQDKISQYKKLGIFASGPKL